jgi:hypothetical protein
MNQNVANFFDDKSRRAKSLKIDWVFGFGMGKERERERKKESGRKIESSKKSIDVFIGR